MNQTEALRQKYSDLTTETLRELWANGSRADWAEMVLRDELIARGIAPSELEQIAKRREEIASSAPPSVRDTIWKFGFVGRMVAIASTFIAFILFNSLFGKRVAAYAMVFVFAIYVVILVRRVFFQSQFRIPGGATFAMIWQSAEAVLILLALVVLAVTLPKYP